MTGYHLGLTAAPIALLGLYLSFGIAGVLGFPVTLIFDKEEALTKKISVGWVVIMLLFCLFLFLGSMLAIYIGVLAVPAHLASPP